MVWRTLYRIGRRPSYSGLFLLCFTLIMSVVAILPNLALAIQITAAAVPLSTKLSALLALYGYLYGSFTTLTLLVAFLFAFLTALNVTVLTYYIRRRRVRGGSGLNVASVGGFVSGALGLGCAACGSIVLSAVAGMLGGLGFLAFLPLGGTEFSFVGIALLLLSSVTLLRHINDPMLCEQRV